MANDLKFFFLGNDIRMGPNVNILEPEKVSLGNNVAISDNVSINVHPQGNIQEKLRIEICDRAYIGGNTIIESFNKIIVEQDVLIGPSVYVSDSQHQFKDPYLPPFYQGYMSLDNTLKICRGAWIGHAATLVGGIIVGQGSVVGANCVLTYDIPSHCVVVGNPARVLKLYHYKQERWIEPCNEGELLSILNERGSFEGYNDKYILEALQKQVVELNEKK